MSQFEHLSNLGLHQVQNTDTLKRLQLVNLISFSTFTMGLFLVVLSSVLNLYGILPLILAITASTLVPIFLNKSGRYTLSRVYFLLQGYVIIFCLSTLFPPEFQYNLFLIHSVGLPFILFKNEIGNKKWWLAALALPTMLAIDWINLHAPIFFHIDLSSEEFFIMQSITHVILLITAGLILYLFTKQSDIQVDTIEEQNEKLNNLNKDLEDFSYILTHDLKAPLQNVRALIDLINVEYNEDINDELAHYFSLLSDKTQKMDNLIQDVLAYSKVGHNEISVQTIDLSSFVTECYHNVVSSPNFSIKLPTLPQIETNATQLSQVLSNLMGNAVKYHDKESGHIELQFEDKDPHFYKFSIIDDGPGIAPENHSKIFEFMGTANNTQRADSTGIGLAIVKKLVASHQGEIGVISDLGAGSTFWFTWPKNILAHTNHQKMALSSI